MDLLKYFNKNDLHHAYLIEGNKDKIIPEILSFMKNLDINVLNNPDFINISIDILKINDAQNLKFYIRNKPISSKKIIIISANNILIEAQNSLLKIFEEPIENTIFFLILPDTNILLKTLLSRFYFIKDNTVLDYNNKEILDFIKMSFSERILFIKELLIETKENQEAILISDSTKSKALKFLNNLEFSLYQKLLNDNSINSNMNFFKHFFEVRKYLRIPGSSAKTLLESIALIVPEN